MKSSWKTVRLGDVITLQRGFDLPSADRRQGNVPVVSSSGITGWHDRSKVPAPGVVTGRYGTLGQVFFIREDYWPLNTTLYVRDFKGNDPKFISYLLKTLNFQALNDKSSVPGLNRNHLHELPIRIPKDIGDQRAIAHVLGALDDKIELNRQMNETLDEIARTLFTSWFVNFDPVRAKIEARQPEGMDAETAGLFPDRLVESDIGSIPEGWHVGSLSSVLTNYRSTVHPAKMGAEVSYLSLEHMPRRSIALSEWSHSKGLISAKSAFNEGDILFGRLRPYFHKVGIAPIAGVTSTDVLVLKPTKNYWYSFGVTLATSDPVISYVTNAADGTRMPRASWDHLASYPIALPPIQLANKFETTLRPLFGLIKSNILEASALTEIRDTLLPRLLSGQIEYPTGNEVLT